MCGRAPSRQLKKGATIFQQGEEAFFDADRLTVVRGKKQCRPGTYCVACHILSAGDLKGIVNITHADGSVTPYSTRNTYDTPGALKRHQTAMHTRTDAPLPFVFRCCQCPAQFDWLGSLLEYSYNHKHMIHRALVHESEQTEKQRNVKRERQKEKSQMKKSREKAMVAGKDELLAYLDRRNDTEAERHNPDCGRGGLRSACGPCTDAQWRAFADRRRV